MSELPKSRRRRVRRRVITDGAPDRARVAKTYHRPRRCGMHRHATNLMSSGPQPRHRKAKFPPTGSAAQGDRSSTKLPSRHQEPDRRFRGSPCGHRSRIHCGAERQSARMRPCNDRPPTPNHRAPTVPPVPGGQSAALDAYLAMYPTGRRAQTALVIPWGHQPCRSHNGMVLPFGSQTTMW